LDRRAVPATILVMRVCRRNGRLALITALCHVGDVFALGLPESRGAHVIDDQAAGGRTNPA